MSDVRSMTYAEIAVALGIGADSARNLVRRKRWHRRPGNDGLARIDVPIEHLDRAQSDVDGPIVTPADANTGSPIRGKVEGPTSDFAVSVLAEHVRRCEAEIERLKREIDTVRERASEREVIAAQMAGLSVAIHDLRSERNHWRDQAQRLSQAISSPRRRPWFWSATGLLRSRKPDIEGPERAEADQRTRSAREAARDAGLIPSQTSASLSAADVQFPAVPQLHVETASPLDPGGPQLSVADLGRAIERLAMEMDSGQVTAVQLPA